MWFLVSARPSEIETTRHQQLQCYANIYTAYDCFARHAVRFHLITLLGVFISVGHCTVLSSVCVFRSLHSSNRSRLFAMFIYGNCILSYCVALHFQSVHLHSCVNCRTRCLQCSCLSSVCVLPKPYGRGGGKEYSVGAARIRVLLCYSPTYHS